LENTGTEIRSFYTIKEINDTLEQETEQIKSVADEYSLWLGSFLRGSKIGRENEEWAKKMTAFQKAGPKAKPTSVKEDKTKKAGTSSNWVQFKEIKLSATEQGEAEILFDAIEELNRKIEQLEKVKSVLTELEKSGLGKDTVYITYIHDGVPEKIVLRTKKDQEFMKKFQYIADFSLQNET
jgi:hypothetical protein